MESRQKELGAQIQMPLQLYHGRKPYREPRSLVSSRAPMVRSRRCVQHTLTLSSTSIPDLGGLIALYRFKHTLGLRPY